MDTALVEIFRELARAEYAAQDILADSFRAIKDALTTVWGEQAVRSIGQVRPHCPRLRVFVDPDYSLLVELDGPAGAATITLARHAHHATWGPCPFELETP